MMNFDYKFIRDCGIESLLPHVRMLSDETLFMVLAVDWFNVSTPHRLAVRSELQRRYPDLSVAVLPNRLEQWRQEQSDLATKEWQERLDRFNKKRWWQWWIKR